MITKGVNFMLSKEYPNYQLIEYKTKTYLQAEFQNKLKERHQVEGNKIEFHTFSQIWSNTATAFDINSNGQATIAGQAFTQAYTTVAYIPQFEIYYIFIANEPCYKVSNPTEEFFKDLKQLNLKPLSKALKFY